MAFFDNIKFPFFTMQELNLDWIMNTLKTLVSFMPTGGNAGDVLTRKTVGAAWEKPEAVNINIDALPQDTAIVDNDELIFYDKSVQANRKITPPDLLDSMCSNAYPLMNGTAAAGTSKKPARYDHVHPVDTSRQAALSGTQMNAVNSGAPSNSFFEGKLSLAHGGTGASNAATARANLEVGKVTSYHGGSSFTSTVADTYEYTGTHFFIPAGAVFGIRCQAVYSASQPTGIALAYSDSSLDLWNGVFDYSELQPFVVTGSAYANTDLDIYIWVKHASSGSNPYYFDWWYLI